MRRILFVLLATTWISLAGCSAYDLVFEAMSNYYSAGGADDFSRRAHFQSQLQDWENHHQSNLAPAQSSYVDDSDAFAPLLP